MCNCGYNWKYLIYDILCSDWLLEIFSKHVLNTSNNNKEHFLYQTEFVISIHQTEHTLYMCWPIKLKKNYNRGIKKKQDDKCIHILLCKLLKVQQNFENTQNRKKIGKSNYMY